MEYSQELIKELLNEAYRRYPKGTEFKSAYRGTPMVSYGIGGWANNISGSKNIIWSLDEGNANYGWLYKNGKWAEIISYPKNYIKPQIINTYSIY